MIRDTAMVVYTSRLLFSVQYCVFLFRTIHILHSFCDNLLEYRTSIYNLL